MSEEHAKPLSVAIAAMNPHKNNAHALTIATLMGIIIKGHTKATNGSALPVMRGRDVEIGYGIYGQLTEDARKSKQPRERLSPKQWIVMKNITLSCTNWLWNTQHDSITDAPFIVQISRLDPAGF